MVVSFILYVKNCRKCGRPFTRARTRGASARATGGSDGDGAEPLPAATSCGGAGRDRVRPRHAKEAKLVSVRVLDWSGQGTTEQVVAGIDRVTRNAGKPAVANMSLGGDPDDVPDAAVRNSSPPASRTRWPRATGARTPPPTSPRGARGAHGRGDRRRRRARLALRPRPPGGSALPKGPVHVTRNPAASRSR